MKLNKLRYALLIGLASIFSLAKIIIYARILPLGEFGQISLILSTYAVVTYVISLGANEGLLKQSCMEENQQKREELFSSAIMYTGLTSFLFTFLLALAVFYYLGNNSLLILATSLLVLSSFFYNLVESSLRSGMQFGFFAGITFFKGFFSLILGSISALYLDSYLIIVFESLINFLIAIIYAYFFSFTRFSLKKSNLLTAKEIIKNGIPLATVNLIKKLYFSLDRWIILFFLGSTVIAEYSFVMILYSGYMSLIGIANTVIGPLLLRDIGKHKNIKPAIKRVKKIILISILPITLCSLFIFTAYPKIVAEYFKVYSHQYIFLAANLVNLGLVALTFSTFLEWLLIGSNNNKSLVIINLMSLLLMTITFIPLAYSQASIEKITLFFAIVQFIKLLIIIFTITNLVKQSFR